ncbi:MAG: hypothetical protein IJQ55_05195 [Alphaproteobacteria bacterium]|nr:hypothetical protein [Alphaproteobacteria bacterium]
MTKKIVFLLFAILVSVPALAAKEYKIPESEKPKITGLGTCQQIAEQAIYCSIMQTEHVIRPSECSNKILVNNLQYQVQKAYTNIGLNSIGYLKEKWQRRNEVLPVIKEACEISTGMKSSSSSPQPSSATENSTTVQSEPAEKPQPKETKQNNTKKQPVVEITDKDRKNAKKLCEKDGKHVYDGTRCNEKTDTTQADDTKQFKADSEKLAAAFKTTVAKLNAKSE